MFFIIGFNKNTKDDSGTVWIDQDGEEVDFEYVEQSVIASGKTKKELIASIKEYKRLREMT